MRNPSVYKTSSLLKWDAAVQNKDGRWVPARPLGWQGPRWSTSIKIAFYVLIGKYDALDWED